MKKDGEAMNPRTITHGRYITLTLAALLLLGASSGFAQEYRQRLESVRVVGVSDGDTITVLTKDKEQVRVRLAGIDAPESAQAFGDRAKQKLSDLVFGKTVTVLFDKQDRYGRTLGKVLLGEGDMNMQMLLAGLAWHYKEYQNEQPEADRDMYGMAEAEARESRLGLWTDANPIAPSVWRRSKRGGATTTAAPTTPTTPPRATTSSPRETGNGRASSSGNGRAYIRGSRGGCYYLSGSGRKVYVDRDLCNQ
jgi:endonuclease YncB( thermonuclease family)